MNDTAIDQALDVWREEADVPYSARINDYLRPDGTPDSDALGKADEEAERKNRDLMRRAIEAAAKPLWEELVYAHDRVIHGPISDRRTFDAYRNGLLTAYAIVVDLPEKTIRERLMRNETNR